MRDDNKPGDFVYIAGKEEANMERRVPQAPLLEGISILLNWRKLTAFRCTVEVTFSDGSSEHDLIARPRNQSYRVTDMASGFVEAYDAHTGMMQEGDTERPLLPNYISWEPLAARLAFPLSLGIWGRPGDSFRITGADRAGDRIVLGLEHQEDSALLGTLTIDVRRRMAVHLDTPILGLEYRDIQPAQEYVIEVTP